MKTFLSVSAIALLVAAPAPAITVTFSFSDADFDDTFEVYFAASQGDNNGLATYNVALTGLDDSPLDPSTFAWTQNTLGNFDSVSFLPQGIQSNTLLEDPIGTNGYSAANTQFQSNDAIFGIGQVPVFEPDNPDIPTDEDVDLRVPALLGTLTIPGASILIRDGLLTPDDFEALWAPNAAVFTGTDTGSVVTPDNVIVFFALIPEPSTALLVGLAAAALAARRR